MDVYGQEEPWAQRGRPKEMERNRGKEVRV